MASFGHFHGETCAVCDAHHLEALSVPRDAKDVSEYVYRIFMVLKTCSRCEDKFFCQDLLDFPSLVRGMPGSLVTHVPRVVILPMSFIGLTSVLAGMSHAHDFGRTKGQNADLQLVQNSKFLYKDDDAIAWAVRTVGVAAIRDEESNDKRMGCLWSVRGTPWKPWVIGVSEVCVAAALKQHGRSYTEKFASAVECCMPTLNFGVDGTCFADMDDGEGIGMPMRLSDQPCWSPCDGFSRVVDDALYNVCCTTTDSRFVRMNRMTPNNNLADATIVANLRDGAPPPPGIFQPPEGYDHAGVQELIDSADEKALEYIAIAIKNGCMFGDVSRLHKSPGEVADLDAEMDAGVEVGASATITPPPTPASSTASVIPDTGSSSSGLNGRTSFPIAPKLSAPRSPLGVWVKVEEANKKELKNLMSDLDPTSTTGNNLPILEPDKISDEAETAHMVERLQAGVPLGSCTTLREPRTKHKDTSMIPEVNHSAGFREATTRFPQLTCDPQFLPSNNVQNVISCEDLRRTETGIGKPTQSPQEDRNMDLLSDALIKTMFTEKAVKKALEAYTQLSDKFAKKHGQAKRDKMADDLLDCYLDEGSLEVFIKKEVSAKSKPRGIVNHGDTRQAMMAKLSFVFEKILFSSVEKASIKGKTKAEAIKQIAVRFSEMQDVINWKENDMTSFDFGITALCKKIENKILKHLSKLIFQEDEVPFEDFTRHMEERGSKCRWTFTYVDESGAKCKFTLYLPVTMRESGDRITSSGNWIQNLAGWVNFLVDPPSYEVFLTFFLKAKGAPVKYKSARDGRFYWVGLAFEGDDTLAAFSEDLDDGLIEDFFKRRGWLPKLKTIVSGVATFVGYHVCLLSAKVVLDEAGDMLVLPEINRCLTTKSWTTSVVPEAERPFVECLNAMVMAAHFENCPPMWYLWNAVFSGYGSLGTKALTKWGVQTRAILVDSYMKSHGDMPTDAMLVNFTTETAMPPCKEVSDTWRTFAEMCAGPCTDAEWCMSSGLTNVDMHGADLACYFPAAWLSKK